MKLTDIKKRIPLWYQAAMSDRPDRLRCIYLTSAPGRGKTTVLVEAVQDLSKATGRNLGLVVLSGPLLNPADSIGYLVPKHEGGRAESVYTDPFWFRTNVGRRLDEYEGGIIVVDEADKMDPDVKKAIGEAALSGRLGPHTLPEGWVVWMAGNRASDRSGSTKELDHLINRRMQIEVWDDIRSWVDWAVTHGVMPVTVAFAEQNPGIVFTEKAPEKQGPWCTPRSLVMADGYLQTLGGEGRNIPSDALTMEEVAGIIGGAATAQLFTFVKLEQEMPKFEKIVADPKGVKVPEKPDAQMLICYNLAHRVDDKTADPVITYIQRMPKEFAVTFAKAACNRNYRLLMSPAFAKWTKENASLMAMLNG